MFEQPDESRRGGAASVVQASAAVINSSIGTNLKITGAYRTAVLACGRSVLVMRKAPFCRREEVGAAWTFTKINYQY